MSVRSKNSLIKISPDTQAIDFKNATNLEVMIDANVSDNRIGKELLEFELKVKIILIKMKLKSISNLSMLIHMKIILV